MEFLLLADGNPVSAMLAMPGFKTVATWVIVIGALLFFFAPTAFNKLKDLLKSIVLEVMQNVKLPIGDAQQGTGSTGQTLDIGDVIKKRAAELRTACPKAPADLRLTWLEQGFDEDKAKTAYISVLESKIATPAEPAPQPAPATTPA